jgi:hypothetical protein
MKTERARASRRSDAARIERCLAITDPPAKACFLTFPDFRPKRSPADFSKRHRSTNTPPLIGSRFATCQKETHAPAECPTGQPSRTPGTAVPYPCGPIGPGGVQRGSLKNLPHLAGPSSWTLCDTVNWEFGPTWSGYRPAAVWQSNTNERGTSG